MSSSIAGGTGRLPRGSLAATLQQTLITHIAYPLNIHARHGIHWGRTSKVVAGRLPST